MDTLDRFLIKEFLIYFLVILLGCGVLFLAIDFFANFSSVQLPFGKAVTYFLYKLPDGLQKMVPIACLLAALLVLTNMSRQNEILALYANGISRYRLVSTFIAVVAVISTVSFLVFDSIVPAFQKRQILLKKGLDPAQESIVVTGAGGFWYRSGKLIYNVGRFDPATNSMEDVNIYVTAGEMEVTEHVHARAAHYQGSDWVLEDGVVVNYFQDHFPALSRFKTRTGLITEKPAELKSLKARDDVMRLRDLRKYITKNNSSGLDTTSEKLHYHERLALVFTPLLFVLVGIPLVLKPLRNPSVARSVAFCFAIILVYLFVFRTSLSIGLSGQIPAAVAGWLPNMLMLFVAVFLFSRKG